MSVSSALGNAAAGIRLDLGDGRALVARPITQRLKSAVERVYQSRARKAVCALEGSISSEAFRQQLNDLAGRIEAGEYGFVKLLPKLETPDGALVLAGIVFDTDEDTVLEVFLGPKASEAKAILDQIVKESFPNAARGTETPAVPPGPSSTSTPF